MELELDLTTAVQTMARALADKREGWDNMEPWEQRELVSYVTYVVLPGVRDIAAQGWKVGNAMEKGVPNPYELVEQDGDPA